MKRVVKNVVLFVLLFMPFIVNAAQYTYNGAITRANNYINNYDTRNKYLLFGVSYEFDGTIKPNNTFVNGGLINKVEYEVGGRYLSPGAEYWTMTSVPDGAKQYTISNILRSDRNRSEQVGVRITEYVKPNTSVTGNGTKAHPWEFRESYVVYIGSNDVNKGTVSESEIQVAKGGTATLSLYPKYNNGYRYKVSTCGLSFNASTGVATIRNVQKDINCLVIFDNQIYTFDLVDSNANTQASPNKLILEYRNTWFSDTNLAHRINQIIIPKRTGYKFKGYKFNGVDVIDQDGNILRTIEPTSLTTTNYRLTASWEAIQYTCTEGTYLPKGKITCAACKAGSYCPGGSFYIDSTKDQGINACPDGYTSVSSSTSETSCYINVSANHYIATSGSKAQTACPAGSSKPEHVVFYGSVSACDTCTAGSYSSGSSGCVTCPSGYTSDAGATSINKCYMNVPGGKYLGTANSETPTSCPAGTFNPAHKVNYGSTSKCSDCTAGTYSTGGASSCTNCPSGYTSDAKATAENKCYINVGAGKYIATAKSSTQTSCPAGTARAAHKVNYGSTSSCTSCSNGTYSTGGAATCTNCPSGYTSGTGTTAENRCYINISGGNYLGTAKGTTQTSCAAGTYKGAHTVYYGSTSSCTACNNGQYSAEGATSCSTCPAGYRDGAPTNSQSNCKRNIPGGQYLATAKGTSNSTCAAGTAKAAHSVNYGGTSSCGACGKGQYSAGGASSCSTCPAGYRDGAATTSQSYCSRSIPGGQYMATARGTSNSTCNAGTYKAAHSVNYGGTSSCGACGKGQYSASGASSCSTCPAGYRDGAATTTQNNCSRSIPGGQYMATARGTSNSTCPAGQYRAAHSVSYGGTSSCASCTGNTYSSTSGASSCTSCPSGQNVNSNHTGCSAPPKTVTVTFNYNKASWNGGTTTRQCTTGANGTCTVTAPSINNLSGGNSWSPNGWYYHYYSELLSVKGWNTNSSATYGQYSSGAQITVSDNTTYYAIVTLNRTSVFPFTEGSYGVFVRNYPGGTSVGLLPAGSDGGPWVQISDWTYVGGSNPLWLYISSYSQCSCSGVSYCSTCNGYAAATWLSW